ncbi:hypothetical protein G5714_018400 [Onychostoma macrolepis]|uniref:Uncharacterized protein n=1 Tax=Onychostoma macrolepis TaxID=369639 RepID=A0A7J6BZP2_9TELE|nr:hypothetical protein G5714_018400 [Onychostoma macrolepis]
MDLTARRQTSRQDRNDEKTAKSNVASGGEQTKMDLALWEINVVLRVELWDTGSQRWARHYMAKWQLSDGNILLAEDFWLPGVTD